MNVPERAQVLRAAASGWKAQRAPPPGPDVGGRSPAAARPDVGGPPAEEPVAAPTGGSEGAPAGGAGTLSCWPQLGQNWMPLRSVLKAVLQ